MRRREHQSGFGTLEILLFVLVVAVLAIVGVVVPQHHKPISALFSAATSQKPTITQPQSTTTTTQSPQTTTQYLTITEWGVKAPYSGNDTLTYTLSSDNNIAYISSKQLTSADAQCTRSSAGSIRRYTATGLASPYNTGPTIAETASQNPGLYTHVGNYYYIFAHAQSACGSVSVSTQNQANDTVKALVPNLQPIAN